MNAKGTAKGTPGAATDPGVLAAATRAAELVTDGARVGLGSGRAASAFIAAIGARRAARTQGVGRADVGGVRAAGPLAGIPLIDIDEETLLDLTVDGADEVSPNLDLVKGRGAAFVRERIVAAASRRQVILVTPREAGPGALREGRRSRWRSSRWPPAWRSAG